MLELWCFGLAFLSYILVCVYRLDDLDKKRQEKIMNDKEGADFYSMYGKIFNKKDVE